MVNFLGLFLVAIWSLSLVGGQASFRQMTFGSRASDQPSEFTYMVHSGSMDRFGDSDGASYLGIVNTLFVASIIAPAPTKSSPRDTWGNVKVPMIEHYESSTHADDNGWFTTTNGDETIYSSIVGIPMAGTDLTDFINYVTRIKTVYFRLDCPTFNSNFTGLGPNNTYNNVVIGDSAKIWGYINSTGRIQQAQSDIESFEPLNFTYLAFMPTMLAG